MRCCSKLILERRVSLDNPGCQHSIAIVEKLAIHLVHDRFELLDFLLKRVDGGLLSFAVRPLSKTYLRSSPLVLVSWLLVI